MTLSTQTRPEPPEAEKHPHVSTLHGETRHDDYAWLREKSDPKVIAYLEAENAYAEALTADSAALQTSLYTEMLARIQQTDLSVPYPKGGWLYYARTEEGKQYPTYCRRRGTMDAPEEVLLDLNAMAEGLAFMAVGDFEVSPDGSKLAYSTDTTGYRQYVLHVQDLATGEVLPDTAERVTSIAWCAEGRTLFYTQEDETSKRSYRVYRHVLGDAAHDLVAEEGDERFGIGVHRTRSGEWLVESRTSHTTCETRVLRADDPKGTWTLIAPRVQDREYYVDHRGGLFYIMVNDTSREFRVVTAPVETPDPAHWSEFVAAREGVTIRGVSCFADFIVLSERESALPHMTVMDLKRDTSVRVRFEEPAYSVGSSTNEEFAATTFRYAYQSFVTPPSVFDLDLATRNSKLLKRTAVLGGWDASRYEMQRISAKAADGTAVPVTLLYRKGTQPDGSAPCLLYAYGSYGISIDVTFSSARYSLVDRGAVFALAHIRGGGDLGQRWHDDGRMAKKMNTFTDFIACAEHLIASKWTSRDRLVIQGGSAGGLLMGAVTNLRPDLFAGVVSQVPFVDVINTMLDTSLPLTVGEYEEWGDPHDATQYAWIRAYSPYDNMERKAYPAILVKTGLNDSQVGYWEPAKYVARLRTLKTDANPLLFKINMGAGHGGSSGRYDALREVAFDFAWMLGRMGLSNVTPLG